MRQLKKTIEEHALNQDSILSRIHDVNKTKERRFAMRKHVWLSVGFAAVLILGLAIGLNQRPVADNATLQSEESQDLLVYAQVSVDINPSFTLYLNKPGKVVEIVAINDDAKTLKIDDLTGKPAEWVIEQLIQRATAAGFIDINDGDEDFVLLSTVVLDEDDPEAEENQDSLGQKIQAAVLASETIEGSIKVAVIKATLREKFEAEGKDIPLGLYIINGMIESPAGTWIKVSEFVSNKDNVDKLEKRAEITVRNQTKFIQHMLDELKAAGVDVTTFETMLASPTRDLEQIKALVKARYQLQFPDEDEEEEKPLTPPGQDKKNS